MTEDAKYIVKWAIIAGCTLFSGNHLKNFADEHADDIKIFTNVIFADILNNQKDIIFLMHIDQFQKDGHSLDKSIELANELLHPPEDDDGEW